MSILKEKCEFFQIETRTFHERYRNGARVIRLLKENLSSVVFNLGDKQVIFCSGALEVYTLCGITTRYV